MEEKEIKSTLKKNQTADIPTKNGNKYSYQYVDIAQIHDYLESINAKYIQQIQRIEQDDYIMTKRCFNGVWENEWLQGSKVVDATLYGNDNPAQKQGSALTYARRYSLLMAFGLATEDDDANSLNKSIEENKKLTLEEAQNKLLEFGKYRGKGKTYYDVYKSDKQYLVWMATKETPVQTAIECLKLFDSMPINKLKALMEETKAPATTLLKKFNKNNLEDLTAEEINSAIDFLEDYKKQQVEKLEQAKQNVENVIPKNMLEQAEQEIESENK